MIEVKGLKEEAATLNSRNVIGVGYFQTPRIGAWNENRVERRVFLKSKCFTHNILNLTADTLLMHNTSPS